MRQEAKRLTYRVELPGGLNRLRDMILYVSTKSYPMPRYGKTKLNKILWKADFAAFAERGMPVTGRPYQKLKAGPAPLEMPIILLEMERDGLIEIDPTPVGNMVEQRVVAKIEPNLHYFSPDDIRFVDLAIQYFWDNTARETSDISHGIAWLTRDELDPMPYESAILSDDRLSEAALARFASLGQQFGWKSQ
jgi:hypothetical protein